MKRSRPKPVSDKRRNLNVIRRISQEEAWGPRPWYCRFTEYVVNSGVEIPAKHLECFGEVNGHEILSRARSGKDENLTDVKGQVPLCNFHNGWVTENDDLATQIGLSKHFQSGGVSE